MSPFVKKHIPALVLPFAGLTHPAAAHAEPPPVPLSAGIGSRAEAGSATLPEYLPDASGDDLLDLKGVWEFAIDPKREGVAGRWFARDLGDTVALPGTMAENRKGTRMEPRPRTNSLSVEYDYRGAAWYRKKIVIPESWRGLRAELSIGRCKVSRAWFDDVSLGENNALGVTQRFSTGALVPGTHTITVMVDNAARPAGRSGDHMMTSEVQSDWNGLLGDLRLRGLRSLRIDADQVIPDVSGKRADIRIRVANDGLVARDIRWGVRAFAWNTPGADKIPPSTASGVATIPPGGGDVIVRLPLGPDAVLWDEFSPALYRAKLVVEPAEGGPASVRETVFGLREFRREGTRFVINGKKVLLRGKHDAMAFPITGYAPMDEASWYRVLSIAKSYGINHYRFHTCTPPEAAFRAADRLGIYLQPELYNNQGDYSAGNRAAYNAEEGMRILKEYGDHPSFVMFALGNEMAGGRDLRAKHIAAFRDFDPTRLYAQGTNNEWWSPKLADGDDYWTTVRTEGGSVAKAVRGSFAHVDSPLGYIQTDRPSTEHDYSAAIADVAVPVIGQETGQYQVFPDFREIAKYTGVQKPWNLMTFKSRLEKAGMGDRNADFAAASGALAVICYREEIEAALRTPGFGGFQLLDLQDYPGQGSALVGILDAFMDSKGLVSPEDWSRFCGPVVPLALFKSYTWTTAERFVARVKVAQYGPAALPAGAVIWRLTDAAGAVLRSGRIECRGFPQGEPVPVGEIAFPLAKLPPGARYKLALEIEGTAFRNDYPLWVYPEASTMKVPSGVTVATRWDAAAKASLESGGTLVLLPEPEVTKGVDGFYTPDFWNYRMFGKMSKDPRKQPPGTMGLLIDAKHPALRLFPTETHSDRQWFDLVTGSKALILDDAPKTFRPIVQVIDNVERNHRLGALFEARVGKGRLVVCSFGLSGKTGSPVAQRLMESILDYAPNAAPSETLSYADVDRIFNPPPESAAVDDPAYFETFFRNSDAK